MEKTLYDQILLAASKLRRCVLFRNNTGLGWVGQVVKQSTTEIIIKNPRPLRAGLIKGSSDLIGWTTIEVQPHHVGQKFAVFTAIEAKTKEGSGRVDPDQQHFIDKVIEAGGIAGIVRQEGEISELINVKTNGSNTTNQTKRED